MPDAGTTTSQVLIERSDLPALLDALRRRGYRLVGPVVREGEIVYDDLESDEDLPAAWTDDQDGGTYRLKRRQDAALFGYAVGPHSWKKYLFPPRTRLWSADREGPGFRISEEPPDQTAFAFIGVRSCELHAIEIQDRVFLEGQYPDPLYKARREKAFIVAVNCGTAGGTCFCVSMKTGPKVTSACDLALTELLDGERHAFLVEIGSDAGARVMAEVPHRAAAAIDAEAAEAVVAHTATQMGREMYTGDIRELLYRNFDNARWDEVANRCLSCGNCTMACPTCFCATVEDTSDLTGVHAERHRAWDSCFSIDHANVHGGSVRQSGKSQYRQWMTHKLATWIDQFGSSGCVGCGRCITWCPVAIDITEEVVAIRTGEARQGGIDADD